MSDRTWADSPPALRRYQSRVRSRNVRYADRGPGRRPPLTEGSGAVIANYLITVYMGLGLSYADAYDRVAGLMVWRRFGDDLYPADGDMFAAISWLDHGFTAAETYAWERTFSSPSEAVRWANKGWTPTQADELSILIVSAIRRDPTVEPNPLRRADRSDFMEKWFRSKVPPAWALRYVRAGILTPAQARSVDHRRRKATTADDPAGTRELIAALEVLAAFRGPAVPMTNGGRRF